MASPLSILLVCCDPYLAGLYGRKFEREGWVVECIESVTEAEVVATRMRPRIILLENDCVANIADVVRRWRSLPTIYATKIVILAKFGDEQKIREAREAGAADYLILGHFVPQEAVEKMKKLLES
ncbi:MAG: response regulator [Patescibacteria group bacterium]